MLLQENLSSFRQNDGDRAPAPTLTRRRDLRSRALFFALLSPLSVLSLGCEPELNENSAEQQSEHEHLGTPEFRTSIPEPIELADTQLSLLKLREWTNILEFERTLRALGGRIHQRWDARLLAVSIERGAETVLAEAGVEQRWDGVVDPSSIGLLDAAAQRFVRVYNNLFHAGTLPPHNAIAHIDAIPQGDEAFEYAPRVDEARIAAQKAAAPGELERYQYVPYASGTIVVAVLLPESNGSREPSTEDWDDDAIDAAYDKVQRALFEVSKANPNADLKFVIHFESAPGRDGLEGTIDCDYEAGQHMDWLTGDDNLILANLYSRLLDRPEDGMNVAEAHADYLNGLRDRYQADGAFTVVLPRNGRGTASIRAHAYLNGPYTAINDTTSWEVYMHEFGHVFGAADEYCPDACRSPTGLEGYLQIYNANAQARSNSGGIKGGHGEGQRSLMLNNATDAMNGYTRGAWGWIDVDDDGIVDVRDTAPEFKLDEVNLSGRSLQLRGWIEDRPQSRSHYATPFSSNRIVALRYRVDGESNPWIEIPLPGQQRGREWIDVSLGSLPLGETYVEIVAVNDQGNITPTPRRMDFRVTDDGLPTTPAVALSLEDTVLEVGERGLAEARGFDPDRAPLTFDFDLDNDGEFETPGPLAELQFDRAGTYTIYSRASRADGSFAVATQKLLVVEQKVRPKPSVTGPGSQVFGGASPTLRWSVENPEPGLHYNWVIESLPPAMPSSYETGFQADLTEFSTQLHADESVVVQSMSLFGESRIPDPQSTATLQLSDGLFLHGVASGGVAVVQYDTAGETNFVTHLDVPLFVRDFVKDGTTVYGRTDEGLVVLDVRDPNSPVIVEQRPGDLTIVNAHEVNPATIPDDGTAVHALTFADNLSIDQIQVRFVLSHRALGQVRVELVPPRESGLRSIVLVDREPCPAARKQYYFTSYTHPELAAYRGQNARGTWELRVTDTQRDGRGGLLEYSQIVLNAFPGAPALEKGTGRLIGVIGGHTLAVSGESGATLIDVRNRERLRNVGKLGDSPLTFGKVVGRYELFALHNRKNPDGIDAKAVAYKVFPGGIGFALRSEALDHYEYPASAGRYLYVQDNDDREQSRIWDPQGFVQGSALDVGRSAGSMQADGRMLGNRYYALGYLGVQTWDLQDPLAPRLLSQYAMPDQSLTQLYPATTQFAYALGFQNAGLIHLEQTAAYDSSMYRVTVQSRDAAGRIASATRFAHHNPYNNAPTAAMVTHLSGNDDLDIWRFAVQRQDVDGGQSWDPTTLARVDFDNDGAWDTGWFWGDFNYPPQVEIDFPTPGHYDVRFQVRDGFWGTSEFVYGVDVAPYERLDCAEDRDCDADEFCVFAEQDSCGATDLGQCYRWGEACPFEDNGEVCACNGRDYANACEAFQYAQSVAMPGSCPDVACGGPENVTCAEGFWCDREADDICGEAQSEGICELAPDYCGFPLPGSEVCGCDGRTYANTCYAHQAGVAVESEGICADDCRVAGCETGSECMNCFGGWSCVPDGAHC